MGKFMKDRNIQQPVYSEFSFKMYGNTNLDYVGL